ncbi:MAG: amidotransferase [Desulfatitalea sp.]|nr:amidotransferase [Desulfatitalea sp.]
MRVHYLQHVPFEGLGHIANWVQNRAHALSATPLYTDAALPDMHAFDFLVIMGGPMGVHDTPEHHWLTREKHFIESALKAGKKVLGICLGAQLIADVLGAKVYPNRHKEIGWHAVTRATDALGTRLESVIPDRFFAFHWHGDTFELPSGAVHLAQSDACRHQAFWHPPGAVGLQFHLESSRESIEALIRHCSHELVPAAYIQRPEEIRRRADLIAQSNALMRAILDFIAGSGQQT